MEASNWNWSQPMIILLLSFSVNCYGQEEVTHHHDTENTFNYTNVILLSYHRAGSSFVGETLAVNDNFSFFFEPLFHNEHILQSKDSQQYQDTLGKLLNCDSQTLDNLRNLSIWVIRKFGQIWSLFKDKNLYPADKLVQLCSSTPIHLTKTIRFRAKDALELLANGTVANLKIIHLIRDPRARYNSANSKQGTWSEKEKSVDYICQTMEQDVQLVDAFPKNVYRLVKYEDIVKDPAKIIRDLYENFLGTNMTPEVELYIQKHTKAENIGDMSKEALAYYSTFRNSDFDHEHWKSNLNTTIIGEIQQKCSKVLDKYGYTLVDV